MSDLAWFQTMRLKSEKDLETDLYTFRVRSADIEYELVRLGALGSDGLRSKRLDREWYALQSKIADILMELQLRHIRDRRLDAGREKE